jgi:hypothetical protein
MSNIPVTPELTSVILVLFLVGTIASGLTEILKLWCRRLYKKEGADSTWWQGFFRLVPIALGCALGQPFLPYPWGVSIGAAGGVLSVVLYRKSRELIKGMASPFKKD